MCKQSDVQFINTRIMLSGSDEDERWDRIKKEIREIT